MRLDTVMVSSLFFIILVIFPGIHDAYDVNYVKLNDSGGTGNDYIDRSYGCIYSTDYSKIL